MRTKITLNTFRRISRLEEAMIRAAMPLTAQADPEPLVAFHAPAASELVATRQGTRLTRPAALRATIGEVVACA